MSRVFMTCFSVLVGMLMLQSACGSDGVSSDSLCDKVVKCVKDAGASDTNEIKSECLAAVKNLSQACLDCVDGVECSVLVAAEGIPTQCASTCSGTNTTEDVTTETTTSDDDCVSACAEIVDCFTGITQSDCIESCEDDNQAANTACGACFTTYGCSKCDQFKQCLYDNCGVPTGTLQGC